MDHSKIIIIAIAVHHISGMLITDLLVLGFPRKDEKENIVYVHPTPQPCPLPFLPFFLFVQGVGGGTQGLVMYVRQAP